MGLSVFCTGGSDGVLPRGVVVYEGLQRARCVLRDRVVRSGLQQLYQTGDSAKPPHIILNSCKMPIHITNRVR